MKKAEKEQALNLRKRGFTLREIAKYVNVSVSTISLWLKDQQWSHKVTEDNQRRASKENSKRFPSSIKLVVINLRNSIPRLSVLQ